MSKANRTVEDVITRLHSAEGPDEYGFAIDNAAAELRRLDAANKELVEALEFVYNTCDWYGDDGRLAMQEARAAIAKHGEMK